MKTSEEVSSLEARAITHETKEALAAMESRMHERLLIAAQRHKEILRRSREAAHKRIFDAAMVYNR